MQRYSRVIALVAAASGALCIHLWRRETSHSDSGGEVAPAPAPSTESRRVRPPRGRILDRNGVALADNRRAFNIYVVPRRFTPKVRARLIDLLHLDAAEVAALDLRAVPVGDADRAVPVLEDQPRERADRVAQARGELAGAVDVHDDSHRVYRHGHVAAHLIGYLGRPSTWELLGGGLDVSDVVGRHGIEQAFDSALRGRSGIEGPRFVPPVEGRDVVLTIDLGLQRLAEKAVGDRAGAAVVVEVETGRILALVSNPSFDPRVMSGPFAEAERARLDADPRRPWLDRTVSQDFPPGSTYKLVTAVAGLESGVAAGEDEATCTGKRVVGKRTLFDMGSHGTVDFIEAVQKSCNVFFWQVGERVGMERLADVARAFGFGTATGLGINDEVAGQVPSDGIFNWRAGDLVATLDVAIGSGGVKLTVVQLAMAYAALANGGRLYRPQVVRRLEGASGELLEDRAPVLRRTIPLSPATLEILRTGMWRAVNAPGGTAYAAHKGVARMAGKTGTAALPGERVLFEVSQPGWDPSVSHAWFVGWVPVDRPAVVIAVFIEHGGVGGAVAAPVGRTIADGYVTRSSPRRRRPARGR